VRAPTDFTPPRANRSRRRILLAVAAAAVVLLLLSLRWIAGLYTDSLWYSSIGQHEVFWTVIEVKVGLFLVFGLVFFFAMWVNLLLCNRLGPSELYLDAPEDELVRRFHAAVRPYAGRLYALLALVLAVIAASTAIGRWSDFLLFSNSQSFGIKDPQFGLDEGFYVFRLPFLTFLVDWVLAALVAIIVFTVIFHYLNGGIRAARVTPRVSPGVKVHLSVLIALLAVAKAAGYLVARWHMVTSTTSGVVEGPGYTDVHARIPALELLFWMCLIAAVILLVNIRQRGWALPAIAIGLWAFVALVIGVIYPAVLQTFKVTPAQSTLEKPYIQRNIQATRAAYNLRSVGQSPFRASTVKPSVTAPALTATLADIRQWDPEAQISQSTYQQLQTLRNYYEFSQLGEDRYMVNGRLTPVNVGVRELNVAGLQNPTWVNQHLQYTHGYGLVISPSNAVQQNSDHPVFDVQGIPTQSSAGLPPVAYPNIYFGLNQKGFVVADTQLKELNYEVPGGASNLGHYHGSGGIPMGNWFRRAMFAIRFHDLNLFLSSLITPKSRIIFVRNVVQIAERAAPFLSIDAHPYAVLVGGHVDWVLDGYTTTDQYAYSQNANTQLVPSDNGLPGSYNYVRNSVKVVVDAYSGRVTLYAMDPTDPILKAWESAFPGLIKDIRSMTQPLREHLKYPQDVFSIQAAVWGRYHISDAAAFYSNSDGWNITPTNGAGSPSNLLKLTTQYDKQGYIVSQSAARMDPLYQIYALPGTSAPQYTMTDAYVTTNAGNASGASAGGSVLNLTAFMVALNDPKHYGQLLVYRPPAGLTGPVQADSTMSSSPAPSSAISLLNKEGSQVLLGNILMIPVNGQMLYVRPMYVRATSSNFPLLRAMIVVYGSKTGFAPTLASALGQVFGGGSGGGGTPSYTVAELLALAQGEYTKAQAALAQRNLAAYQAAVNQMNIYVAQALSELPSTKGASSSSTTTTTTLPSASTHHTST